MARYALLLARPVEMCGPVLDNVQVNPTGFEVPGHAQPEAAIGVLIGELPDALDGTDGQSLTR